MLLGVEPAQAHHEAFFFLPYFFIFIFRNACIVNVFCFLFQHTARIIDLSQRRLPKPSQNQSFFWPLMLQPLTFVPDCGTNTCESNCEHMRQCGGERERKKNPKDCFCCMREKLLVITSHKLPGGRFWTECDENVPKKNKPNKDREAIRTGRTG